MSDTVGWNTKQRMHKPGPVPPLIVYDVHLKLVFGLSGGSSPSMDTNQNKEEVGQRLAIFKKEFCSR